MLLKLSAHVVVSRCIVGWMSTVTIFLGICLFHSQYRSKFFRIGPSSDLVILGIQIDTFLKYYMLVSYSVVNSTFRGLLNDVVQPWIINHVQNSAIKKNHDDTAISYEITLVTTFYKWFDWFLNMNILLSQVDLILFECIADCIITVCSTRFYLKAKLHHVPLLQNSFLEA